MTETFDWRGRRVLVTGHTGFKGGWLCLLLSTLGAEVLGYALAPETSPSFFDAAKVDSSVGSVIGDIRDSARLEAEVGAFEPEIVFHLAAQALVRRARAEPVETFDSNVMGTVRVLEAARTVPSVRAAVIITSDKVYDNVERAAAYVEGDFLGGREPYGASKAACEIVVQAYRHAYFADRSPPLASATARAGNVIGGGDWSHDRLIPDAMRAFAGGAPLVLRNPGAVRPWQHVLEPLAGYLRLAENLWRGSELPEDAAFNFGPAEGDARPVSWVADEITRRWGEGAAWLRDASAHPYEAKLLQIHSTRARRLLGWTPKWSLPDGLDRTVDWYRRFYAGEDAAALTRAQIDAYLRA
jgi:CDP-glucose 4,6-dehydratase